MDEGVDLASSFNFGLIILDQDGIPGGAEPTLRALRNRQVRTPLIVLTSDRSVATKVSALKCGADDILEKPFAFQELTTRIHSVVRRSCGHARSLIECGEIVIDLGERRVARNGQKLVLNRKEFAVLAALALCHGAAATRELLLDHLYGGLDNPDENVTEV
ncbi:response regulator transcription factor [Mongoliimonas terrestris]|uniref:response regulator transcription factor n=1 Tax=Mongoliimonas terrestris TaxID=1709001 RepID=UPI0009F98D2E|nr:response regulator transcription factor [Mongoliimonas terrestris]